MRRTLLTAGVFALLAMIYVPTPSQRFVHPGYRFIFSSDDTSIAFFQLLVNVVFAALLGAVLATIVARVSRRALYVTAGCIAVVALGVGVFAFCQAADIRAQSDERNAEELIRWPRASETMYEKFRNAATNWRLALRFDEATRVENRIKELQQGRAQDWQNDPIVDLSGLPDQGSAKAPQVSPAGNPFDQFDAVAPGSAAANPRAYRVTGLVLELTDTMIAIQKGRDRWEIARNSNTKITGDLNVGAKVTIIYTLTAAGMEVKSDFNPDAYLASHGEPVATPIPKARPVKKSMFDDLIPRPTATPGH